MSIYHWVNGSDSDGGDDSDDDEDDGDRREDSEEDSDISSLLSTSSPDDKRSLRQKQQQEEKEGEGDYSKKNEGDGGGGAKKRVQGKQPDKEEGGEGDCSKTNDGDGARTANNKRTSGGKIDMCKGLYEAGNKAGERCGSRAKADNNGFCGRHTSQYDKGRVKKRKSRPCRGPGGGAAQELTDPIGDDDLSECGSEGAFPGDLADYDENGEAKITLGKGEAAVQARALRNIPEGWARESLKCVFLLVQATARLEKAGR
ncbi:unnamed protein product [Pylaiella littoralis]